MTLLSRLLDERFLAHRQKATSVAGTAAAVLAICLFGWRYFVDDTWSWDLLAVALTAVVVKLTVMLWASLRD